jgi:excisionase family DNA binding protein
VGCSSRKEPPTCFTQVTAGLCNRHSIRQNPSFVHWSSLNMGTLEALAAETEIVETAAVPVIYSIEEVAAMLDCTVQTLAIQCRSGRLPGIKVGRRWVFPAEALIQRLNEVALTESNERRSGKHRPQPRAVFLAVPTSAPIKQTSRRRVPPVLPTLEEAEAFVAAAPKFR